MFLCCGLWGFIYLFIFCLLELFSAAVPQVTTGKNWRTASSDDPHVVYWPSIVCLSFTTVVFLFFYVKYAKGFQEANLPENLQKLKKAFPDF